VPAARQRPPVAPTFILSSSYRLWVHREGVLLSRGWDGGGSSGFARLRLPAGQPAMHRRTAHDDRERTLLLLRRFGVSLPFEAIGLVTNPIWLIVARSNLAAYRKFNRGDEVSRRGLFYRCRESLPPASIEDTHLRTASHFRELA
jgi:hypothetical protein